MARIFRIQYSQKNSAEISEGKLLINCFIVQSVDSDEIRINKHHYFTSKHSDENDTLSAFKNTNRDQLIRDSDSIKSNSCGNDRISQALLKYALPYCTDILTYTVNCSSTDEVFSRQWKKSVLPPLPKGCKVEEFADVRPVSIPPMYSKILGKIIDTRKIYDRKEYVTECSISIS